MRGVIRATSAALLLMAARAQADVADTTLGRYLPLYPGLYLDLRDAHDPRDRVFDAGGDERDTATPSLAGHSSFPLHEVAARFTWTFPLFESQGVPLLSSRLHTARATLRYARVRARGRLADYVGSRDDLTDDGSGVGDTTLEFGTFLWGGSDWRSEASAPGGAGLLLLGINVPTGVYEHEAPVNAGTNHWAFHAQLGGAVRPWAGALFEAGAGYRVHLVNYEPQFGGLAPSEQGDDAWIDLSLAQRLLPGLHLSVSLAERRGRANRYDDPQYAPNAPAAPPNSDTYPTPGRYADDGTSLRSAGLALHWFATQRVLVSAGYVRPLAGRSGEFDLPFTSRSPAGCIEGAVTCTTSPGETVRVDGLGPARSYASDHWAVSLRYNFGQGDTFTCVGCSR
ncbi:transporter [Fontimonas sp. SYSU GA230001]|uniref:transporter n=1 Tax=Fontimonas sp. SYSU GA230001 TaxID=3142450 RepID=UPI0032B51113